MAKITETTPKVERTFTVELTEAEMKLLYVLTGSASNTYVNEKAESMGITPSELPDRYAHGLYYEIEQTLFEGSE